ncbi:hypothetical protein FBU31_005086 [Coemansia sp. 'formosensis']|nr:hypothetical protein FBU31_005086 [Coemansia sp. 'formosensis']
MPPVDIARSDYASKHTTDGAVMRQSRLSVLIEYWRLGGSGVGMDMEQPVKATTAAIVIRQASTALIPVLHTSIEHANHHPCHYKRISHHINHHHYRYRYRPHEHHGHGYMDRINHAMPQHPTLSVKDALHSANIAGFAATEIGFLTISLALSMLLLLIGYKIGDCVYKYEVLRSHSRGRGPKSSHARRQVLSPLYDEKQPIYLDDDYCAEHDDEIEAIWVVAKPLAARMY